ncbi:MAG TPA: hypothetical protein VKA67_02215, partial [Verrucomicrobiae bacterium]|nr:hypothetical protein [Verrucomicrobiae bacterium]
VCPGYEHEAPDLKSMVARKVYFDNPNVDAAPTNSQARPFGNPNGNVPPMKLSAVSEFQPPANAFAISDVDKALPQLDPTVSWWWELPSKPVHGAVRNQLFFDWHVEAVRW